MASRRMKIKVMANVGRMGRPPPENRSVTPTHEIYQNLASPASPTKSLQFSLKQESTKDSTAYPDLPSPLPITDHEAVPSQYSASSPLASPMSPASTHPSMSPDRSSYKSSFQFQAPKSPVRVRSCSPVKIPIPSPSLNQQLVPYVELQHQPKSPTKFHAISETRGPGRGPAASATSSNAVMCNLQKEIGFANVANMNSSETLRQRLQKGSSLNPTTKYHTARKEFLSKYGHNGEKKPDKSELTILHFTFYNPPKMFDDEMNDEKLPTREENMIRAYEENLSAEVKERRESVDVEPESKSTGPRVKVGPDGELIIDEKSLVIETSESQRAKKQLDQMETVSGAGYAVGSSGLYRHKRVPRRGCDWTPMETVKFYRALTACGTDFSMMCQIFPNRRRAELKAKYKREDRRHPTQVSRALSCQLFGPTEEFAEMEDEETLALENSHTEEFSLPPTKKARRKSLNEKEVNVNEELSKVVGGTIVGESPALEAYVRRPKKREKKPKEPKLKLHKGRPQKIMNQKLSFVPDLRDGLAPELKPNVDSYFSFSSPFGQIPRDVVDTPIPLPPPPHLEFTPLPPVPSTPTPKKPVKVKQDKVKPEKKPKPEKVPKVKVIKKVKTEKPPKVQQMKDSDVKVEKKKRTPKIPKPKKVKEKVIINPDHGNSNSCPEILRFDPTDPLGFKIVSSTPADIRFDTLEKPKSVSEPEQIPRLVLVNPPDGQTQDRLTSEKDTEQEIETLIQEDATVHCESIVNLSAAAPSPPRNTRRSRNMKIKPKLRVPTGGDMNKKRQNTSIADEIEIEISCL